jgi:hypothetical protein
MLAPFGTLLVHANFTTDNFEDSSHNDALHGLEMEAPIQDRTNAPIIGNGMCKLEDAAAAQEWESQGPHIR